MNAADIMTRNVVTLTPEASIAEAAQAMVQRRISGLPVIDGEGKVVGIVTEGDLLRRAETGTERHRPRWLELLLGPGRLARDYVDAHARKVGEVMSDDVASVGPQEPLDEVVRAMEKHRVKRLPVVDNDGRLVGIVSRADLVHALIGAMERPAAATAGDEDIRQQIEDEIAKQPWGPRYSVDIKVADGVVDLYGSTIDDDARRAVLVVAENIPGVKAVRDHIVWVEPNSGFVISPDEADPAEKA